MPRKIEATISKSDSFLARKSAKEFELNIKNSQKEIPNGTAANKIVAKRALNTFLKFGK
ncbi:hypothetical protein AGMMS49950_10610 [Endomicrobiia bacterium]|nr:hypothetical protein AGMMS49531_10920 [Endomicrobiia bacterium]GHT72210.1 hypothetical protein AGMMS49950_10610 [Endomicrobiia bacterium]